MHEHKTTEGRASLLDAIARAICCPDGCEVVGCRGRLYAREAAAALAAINAADWVVAPNEATEDMIGAACDSDSQAYAAIYRAMVAASRYPMEAANGCPARNDGLGDAEAALEGLRPGATGAPRSAPGSAGEGQAKCVGSIRR